MAENDIYDSEGKYKRLKETYLDLVNPSENRKYYCRNPANLRFFPTLFTRWEAKDMSFVRRVRLSKSVMIILHYSDKDLKDLDRLDVDRIVANYTQSCKSDKSRTDFIKDFKYIWRTILPEKDQYGREDETIVPYIVRHLSCRTDKSKEKIRQDKLTFEESQKLVEYFSKDIRIQCFIALSIESIGRPQEILFRKIRDVELFDNYAKVTISDHGKEGVKFLECIDSYPYLVKLLEEHPFKSNSDAFLFLNRGSKRLNEQMTPMNVNKQIKLACKHLGITKRITCYSLKRNGVTFRRLSGQSDMEIQKAAGWSSTRQLKTYDMSSHDDAFRIQLIRKGKIKADRPELQQYQPKNKECLVCHTINSSSAVTCSKCSRLLDREEIYKKELQKDEEIGLLKKEIEDLKSALNVRKPYEDMILSFFENKSIQKKYLETVNEK